METTVGRRIAELRRQKGLTQEELAQRLGLSSQAVSKWENDLSYLDILLLPELARLLDTTTDALLTGERPPETQIVPAEARKPAEEMLLKIRAVSANGDRACVNLPLMMLKMALELGASGSININGSNLLEKIDPDMLFSMVEKGMIGKLVEVESSRGDDVEIWVE